MISDMNKKALLDEMAKREDDSIEAMSYYRDDGTDSDGYKYYLTRQKILRSIIIDCASGVCPINRRNIIEEISELCYEKSRLERMLRALDTEIEEQIEFYREEISYEL